MKEVPSPSESRKTKWTSRFKVNWKLAPLKLLLFLMFGALYPFMTIHMTSLGLTLTEIAIIYAILPFASVIGPPVCGFLADKIGNYKIVFIGVLVVNILTHSLLGFAVPSSLAKVRENHTSFPVTLSCGEVSTISTRVLNRSCSIEHVIPQLSISSCVSNCSSPTRICIMTSGGLECWNDLDAETRLFRNGTVAWTKGLIQLKNFSSESRNQVYSVSCVSENEARCKVSCRIVAPVMVTCAISLPFADHVKTIALYTLFRFLAGIAMAALSPLLDAVAYTMAKEHRGDLGFQRMFTLFGMCITPPLSGYFVDLATASSGYENYMPAFALFGGMVGISVIVAFVMPLSVRLPGEHIMKYIKTILRNPKVSIFVLMAFFTGMMWGFLENFLFVFMRQIGSPKWLLGMTNTVSALSAVPVVACSTIIMRYLGHTKIVMICCVLYGFRFLCYSYTYDPFLILPVEILEAFTTSLLWVVTSVYCGKVAPDYVATLQGVVMGAHGAIGRGTGSLIGGIMFDHLKPRLTYRIWAGACMFLGVFYAVLHFAWLRKIPHTVTKSVHAHALDGDHQYTKTDPGLEETAERDLEEYAKTEALLQPAIGAIQATEPSSLESTSPPPNKEPTRPENQRNIS